MEWMVRRRHCPAIPVTLSTPPKVPDPRNPSGADNVRRLAGPGRLGGLRLVALNLDDPGCLLAQDMDPVWREVRELDLVVSLLLDPWQIELVERAAARCPDTDLVVDHLARSRADTAAEHIDRLSASRDSRGCT